jgi:hypothetical protein
MSNTVAQTTVKVSAIDAISAKLARIGGNVGKMERRFQAAHRNISRSMNSVAGAGVALTASLTAPLTLAGRGLFRTVADFESASTRLANSFDAPVAEMEKFQALALDLAPKTPFSPEQIVGAQLELKMAGFDAAQVMAATPDVLNFATVAEISVPKAAELSSDVLRGMGLEVSDLSSIMDQASKAATISNQTTEQFMRGLVRAGPIANAAGMDITSLTANLATLADAGFKGAEGGNALRTILLRLAAPTAAAHRQFDRLGIDMSKFGVGKLTAKSVTSTLTSTGAATVAEVARIKSDIEEALTAPLPEGVTRQAFMVSEISGLLNADSKQQELIANSMSEAISSSVAGLDYNALLREIGARTEALGLDPLPIVKELFGVMRAAQGATLLAGAEGYSETAAKILDSEGIASRAAERLMKTLDGLANAFKSTMDVIVVEWGKAGGKDFFKGMLTGVITLLNTFRALPDTTKMAIAKFAALTAIAGPALLAIALLGKAAVFALSPIMLLAGGIGKLGMFLASTAGLISPIGIAVAAIAATIGVAAKSLLGFLSTFQPLQDVLGKMRSGWTLMWSGWQDGDGARIAKGLKVIQSRLGDLWAALRAGTIEWFSLKLGELAGVISAVSDTFAGWAASHTAIRVGMIAIGMAAARALRPLVSMLSLLARPILTASRLIAVAVAAGGVKGAAAGLAGIMGGKLALALGVVGRLFARLFLSKTAIAMTAIAEVFIALSKNSERFSEALEKIGNGKWREGFGDIGSILKESFSTGAMVMIGAGVAFQIGKGILGGRWKRVGLLAGAMFSGGFRIAAAGLSLFGGLLKGKGRLFASMAGIGAAAMRFLGKGLLRMIPYVGWASLAYDIGKMLWAYLPEPIREKLTAVAVYVGDAFKSAMAWALDVGSVVAGKAADLGRAIWNFHTTTIPGWVSAVGDWFGRQWQAAISAALSAGEWVSSAVDTLLDTISESFSAGFAATIEIGQDVLDGIVSSFTAVGEAIAEAVKAPFKTVADFFIGTINAGLAAINLGLAALSLPTVPTIGQKPEAPLNPAGGGSSAIDFTYGLLSAPPNLMPAPMAAPSTFESSGTSVNTTDRLAQELAALRADMAAGGVVARMDGKADVNINVRTVGGMTAATSGVSSGDVRAYLNTGPDPIAP